MKCKLEKAFVLLAALLQGSISQSIKADNPVGSDIGTPIIIISGGIRPRLFKDIDVVLDVDVVNHKNYKPSFYTRKSDSSNNSSQKKEWISVNSVHKKDYQIIQQRFLIPQNVNTYLNK